MSWLHLMPKIMYDDADMRLDLVSSPSALRTFARACSAALLIGCLGACGSAGGKGGVAQRGTYKIGAPYKIDGVTYTPQEEFNHVETGVASWYGAGFHGKSTANGERYGRADRTAAHRSLRGCGVVRVPTVA